MAHSLCIFFFLWEAPQKTFKLLKGQRTQTNTHLEEKNSRLVYSKWVSWVSDSSKLNSVILELNSSEFQIETSISRALVWSSVKDRNSR